MQTGTYNVEVRLCGHQHCSGVVTFFGGEGVAGDLQHHEWASARCGTCGAVKVLSRAELGKPGPERGDSEDRPSAISAPGRSSVGTPSQMVGRKPSPVTGAGC